GSDGGVAWEEWTKDDVVAPSGKRAGAGGVGGERSIGDVIGNNWSTEGNASIWDKEESDAGIGGRRGGRFRDPHRDEAWVIGCDWSITGLTGIGDEEEGDADIR
ncbi:unnamed protein product, partial [Ectocarpus fasciculatus]